MKRDLRIDMFGLILAGLAVFTAVSLAGHNPWGPVSNNVFPALAEPTNPCGWAGAHLAHRLTQLWGVVAWWVPVVFASAAWGVWRRYEPKAFLLWMLGQSLLSTFVACLLCEIALHSRLEITPSSEWWAAFYPVLAELMQCRWTPAVGPGGQVGLWLADQLRAIVSTTGVYLVVVPLTIISFVMAWEGPIRVIWACVCWLVARLMFGVQVVSQWLWKLTRPVLSIPIRIAQSLKNLIPVRQPSSLNKNSSEDWTSSTTDWNSPSDPPLVINNSANEPAPTPVQTPEPTPEVEEDVSSDDIEVAAHQEPETARPARPTTAARLPKAGD